MKSVKLVAIALAAAFAFGLATASAADIKDRTIKINQDPIEEANLQARLEQIFSTRAERVVFIRGDKDLEFHGAWSHSGRTGLCRPVNSNTRRGRTVLDRRPDPPLEPGEFGDRFATPCRHRGGAAGRRERRKLGSCSNAAILS